MALQGINSQDPEIAVGRIYRIGENPASLAASASIPPVIDRCAHVRDIRVLCPMYRADRHMSRQARIYIVNRRRASPLQSGEHRAPNQIAIAFAAMGQLEEESRQLDRQWTLRRERARYEAERARRQL